MEQFVKILLIIHIIAGSIALLAGLFAILLRNNTKKHRPFGKIYFWCMTFIFFSALVISLYRENWFLFFINIFTYHSCVTAYRSLQLKKLHAGQKPMWYDWGIEVLNITANTALIILGVWLLTKDDTQFGIICLSFGVLGLRISQSTIKRLRNKVKESNYWLLGHIGGMLGSYIGAITAFLVNNNRWIGMPPVAAWLGPAVLLVPLLVYEVNRFKKKSVLVKN